MTLYDREGIENYERRAFFEQVEADKLEILEALKSQVRVYVEYEIEKGNDLHWRDFINQYSEWNHEPLYETIVEEIVRCAGEVREENERKNFGIPFTW